MTLTPYEEKHIRQVVHYENETRRVLNVEAPRIAEIFREHVGCVIYKVNGTLRKVIADQIKFLDHNIEPLNTGDKASLRIWFHTDAGSAYISTSISYSADENHSSYYEGSRYICDMKYGTGILSAVYPDADKQTRMIDVVFQLDQFDKVKGIRSQLSAEEDKLFYAVRRA
jgi:hypothetical protein